MDKIKRMHDCNIPVLESFKSGLPRAKLQRKHLAAIFFISSILLAKERKQKN